MFFIKRNAFNKRYYIFIYNLYNCCFKLFAKMIIFTLLHR